MRERQEGEARQSSLLLGKRHHDDETNFFCQKNGQDRRLGDAPNPERWHYVPGGGGRHPKRTLALTASRRHGWLVPLRQPVALRRPRLRRHVDVPRQSQAGRNQQDEQGDGVGRHLGRTQIVLILTLQPPSPRCRVLAPRTHFTPPVKPDHFPPCLQCLLCMNGINKQYLERLVVGCE